MTGTIFNVQHFCVSDGPGVRTTVFFKGCPLRCLWCHNPESHAAKRELLFRAERCTGCGRCSAVCPAGAHTVSGGAHTLDRARCEACGACADVCPSFALEAAGRRVTADEVLAEVTKDAAFYRDGGGMTLSGGEPLAQPEFALELARRAKAQGLHVAMETCGYAARDVLLSFLPFVDLFLFDVKLTDDALHRKYTGVSSGPILANLRALDDAGAETVLRCPIVPPVNDGDAHFAAIAGIANGLRHVSGIEVEPYHPLGSAKYAHLGKEDPTSPFRVPDAAAVDGWVRKIAAHTAVPVKRS